MVSLASMPESTKHSRSRNRLSQGFVTVLSTILAKGAVSLGANRPDLASEGPKKRSMVSATPASRMATQHPPQEQHLAASLCHAVAMLGHCCAEAEQGRCSKGGHALLHIPCSLANDAPEVQAILLGTKMLRLRCCTRLLGRQLRPAARAVPPRLATSTALAALRIA